MRRMRIYVSNFFKVDSWKTHRPVQFSRNTDNCRRWSRLCMRTSKYDRLSYNQHSLDKSLDMDWYTYFECTFASANNLCVLSIFVPIWPQLWSLCNLDMDFQHNLVGIDRVRHRFVSHISCCCHIRSKRMDRIDFVAECIDGMDHQCSSFCIRISFYGLL